MTDQETQILNRVTGFAVTKVEVEPRVQQGDFMGTIVLVHRAGELPNEFFFPDYAMMDTADMAEVIAHNLREELWNRVRP